MLPTVCTKEENDPDNIRRISNTGSIEFDVSSPKEDSDVETSSGTEEIVYMCKACENKISSLGHSIWFKCTDCGDYLICDECHEREEHKEHADQLHYFMPPQDSDCFCDSCGHEFKNSREMFYNCQQCVNYNLCRICYEEDMHIKHRQQIIYVSKAKFMKYYMTKYLAFKVCK